MIALAVTIKVKKEKVDEGLRFFSSFVRPSNEEPGCIQYELFQSTQDEQVFYFFEKWRDQQALDEHNQQPFLLEFKKRGLELLEDPVQVQFLKFVS